MDESTAMVPLDTRIVDFYGDAITGAVVRSGDTEQIYVPLRPICAYLGIAWSGQYERIKRDAVLSEALQSGRITRMNPRGGDPHALCLPLDLLPGWLFGISARRMKSDLKEKIIRYQRECFRVLWEAFRPDILGPDAPLATGDTQITQLEQLVGQSRTMTRLAEEQLTLARRVNDAARVVKQIQTNVTSVRSEVVGITVRLGTLEERLSPRSLITEEQKADIQQQVSAIAMELSTHDPSKNHFQGIFGELHRRFHVASYHNITQGQYPNVLTFLDEWHTAITTKSIPSTTQEAAE